MSDQSGAFTRRMTLGAAALSVLPFNALIAQSAPPQSGAAPSALPDPRMADRILGSPSAKAIVMEVFSFTCVHCARFAAEVFPKIESELINSGKLRYVLQEFPRDQTDLAVSMIARALPPERFEAFTLDLLRTQKDWAFDPSRNQRDEIARMASFAGMGHDVFEKTLADQALKNAVMAKAAAVEKTYRIHGTPTFIAQGQEVASELSFEGFKKFAGL